MLKFGLQKLHLELGVVTHACHPSSGKFERGGSLGLTGQPARTAYSLSSKPMRDSVSKIRRMTGEEQVWRTDPSLHTRVYTCARVTLPIPPTALLSDFSRTAIFCVTEKPSSPSKRKRRRDTVPVLPTIST